MKLLKPALVALSATAAMWGTTAPGEDFYAGKTITCVVPYAPGGGTDAFFRVVVPHLARTIPGNPDIIINNMSGAGGLKANNYAGNEMPNDGSEILCAPWLSVAQMTRREGVRFDYSKMRPVGGESAINTAVVNKNIMIDGDRTTAGQGPQPLVVAGLAPSSTLDLRQRLGLDILGIDYVYIPGYRGQAKQFPAFMSGEISLIGTNYGSFEATVGEALVDQGPGMLWVEYDKTDADGNVRPRSSQLEDLGVPTLVELYREMHGSDPSGQHWEAYKTLNILTAMGLSVWMPEGTPDEAFNAVKAGWDALPSDPEFIAAHEKAFGKPVNFVAYESVAAAAASVGTIPDDMVQFYQDYIAEGEQ